MEEIVEEVKEEEIFDDKLYQEKKEPDYFDLEEALNAPVIT